MRLVNSFNTRLLAVCQQQVTAAQQATDAAKNRVSSLGLPGSLDALEPASGLTDDLWAMVHDIQRKGGVKTLGDMSSSIQQAATECQRVQSATKEQLHKESTEDGAMRQQFGHRWNRRSSEQLTVQVCGATLRL